MGDNVARGGKKDKGEEKRKKKGRKGRKMDHAAEESKEKVPES